MRLKKVFPLFFLVLLCATQSFAAVTIYTDRSAWETALGIAYSEEFFEDVALNADISVDTDVGYVDTTNQYWWDRLEPAGDETTFIFSDSAIAFGGNWNLAGPGGSGAGIQLTLLNGETYAVPDEIPNTLNNQFWGFISDTVFTDVNLTAGTQGGVETYTLDNMVYAFGEPAPPASIPTLNEWGMMIFSVLLIGIAYRQIRKQSEFKGHTA